MKKISVAIISGMLIVALFWGQSLSALTFAERLAGRILLQVESFGQAWYVNPVAKNRAFLGRPADALLIMRSFGLGITNANLVRIAQLGEPDKDLTFAHRLSGRILLQVEAEGQAWYVNPLNLKRYSLGRPAEALSLMRGLGLGISNENLASIPIDSRFAEPAPTAPPSTPLTLTVDIENNLFVPANIIVKSGTRITWVNRDNSLHAVASDPHPFHTDLPGFQSPSLARNQSYSFTFTRIGNFGFHDHLNPLAKGSVRVEQ